MNLVVPAAMQSREAALVLLVCAAVMLSACEKAPVQNIAAPTPPLTPTTGLTIGNPTSPLSVGQSVQLTALVVQNRIWCGFVWRMTDGIGS